MHHEIAFLNEQLITHIVPTDVSKQKICIWFSCLDQRCVCEMTVPDPAILSFSVCILLFGPITHLCLHLL